MQYCLLLLLALGLIALALTLTAFINRSACAFVPCYPIRFTMVFHPRAI